METNWIASEKLIENKLIELKINKQLRKEVYDERTF